MLINPFFRFQWIFFSKLMSESQMNFKSFHYPTWAVVVEYGLEIFPLFGLLYVIIIDIKSLDGSLPHVSATLKRISCYLFEF